MLFYAIIFFLNIQIISIYYILCRNIFKSNVLEIQINLLYLHSIQFIWNFSRIIPENKFF